MTKPIGQGSSPGDLRLFQNIARDPKDRMIFVDSRNEHGVAYFNNSRRNRAVVWLRRHSTNRENAQRQRQDISQAYERFTGAIRAGQLHRDEGELRRVDEMLAEDMRRGRPLTSRRVRQVLAAIAPRNAESALTNRLAIARHASGPNVTQRLRGAATTRLHGLGAPEQLVSRSDRARISERIAADLAQRADRPGTSISDAEAEAVVRREVEAEVRRCESRLSGLTRRDVDEIETLASEMDDAAREISRATHDLDVGANPLDGPEQRRLTESKIATARQSLMLGHRRLDDLEERLRAADQLDDKRRKLLDDLRENLVDLQVDVADLVADYDLDGTDPGSASPAGSGTPEAAGAGIPDWLAPVAPPSDWHLLDVGAVAGARGDVSAGDADEALQSYLDVVLSGTELHTAPSEISTSAAKLAMRRMLGPAMPMPSVVPNPERLRRMGARSALPSLHKFVGDPLDLSSRELRDRLNVLMAKRRSLEEVRELAAADTPLTDDELQAVNDYIETSTDVNRVLCAGESSSARVDRKIAGLNAALAKLPDNRVTTYRALRVEPAMAERLLAAAADGRTVLTSDGFISTSVAPEVCKTYWNARLHSGDSQVMYEVRGLRGKNIAALPDHVDREMDASMRSYMSEEERMLVPRPSIDSSGSMSGEILFRPGTRFLLVAGAKHHEENRYGFILKELADDAEVPEDAATIDLNRLFG